MFAYCKKVGFTLSCFPEFTDFLVPMPDLLGNCLGTY